MIGKRTAVPRLCCFVSRLACRFKERHVPVDASGPQRLRHLGGFLARLHPAGVRVLGRHSQGVGRAQRRVPVHSQL